MSGEIPRFAIKAGTLSVEEGLHSFQLAVKDVFAAKPATDSRGRDVDVEAWHLGSIMLGSFAGPAICFSRTPQLIAQSGLDHFLVQLYKEGGFIGTSAGRDMSVLRGDICVFDLTDTLETRSTDFCNYSLLIPRDALGLMIDDLGPLHGLVIPSSQPLAAILGEYIISLIRRMPNLSAEDALLAARATVTLTGTALLAELRRTGIPCTGGTKPSLIRRIGAYIDEHIADPALEADQIAHALGLSRASLYRMLAPAGGVARYIRRRRLSGAALELADPCRRARISEIARRWGFATDAGFSRAFRQAFGIAPRLACTQRLGFLYDPTTGLNVDEAAFAGWMRMLHAPTHDRA